MPNPLTVQLNGQPRVFPGLSAPTPLSRLIEALDLKPDRIAVEHNGEIAPRPTWHSLQIQNNDRLEIVHFVGGGGS
jgi:thiamine biosynthesis protein ThiS